MKKELPSKYKEVENNRERVKKLHKSCRNLLEEFGDAVLKPKGSYEGSYMITPTKEIGKNLNIRLSTDSNSGGTFDREEALSGPLFVYICRKNNKDLESMMLIELNDNGKYKIDSFTEKNKRFYGEEIALSNSRVLENCKSFITRLQRPT